MGASIVVNPTGASPDGQGGYYLPRRITARVVVVMARNGTRRIGGYMAARRGLDDRHQRLFRAAWAARRAVATAAPVGQGGGMLRLMAAKNITIDGQVTANGESGNSSSYGGGGGGSGGGILIAAQRKSP